MSQGVLQAQMIGTCCWWLVVAFLWPGKKGEDVFFVVGRLM
jgi:hypothetical protein